MNPKRTPHPQKQLSLALPRTRRGRRAIEHGGEKYDKAGRRKEARPFDPERSLHVTMRSARAVNENSMLHPKRARTIRAIVYRAGRRHGVVVERYVNVGNHFHLHLRTKSVRLRTARPALRAFLREVGGLVARVVTGARKGNPARHAGVRPGAKPSRSFWDHLAWSRVIGRGSKELGTLKRYFKKNERDAAWVVSDQNWPGTCLEFTDPGG